MIFFRVRVYVDKKGYDTFKYNAEGHDWTIGEMERVESMKFIYAKSVNEQQKEKLKIKWKHKLRGAK